MKRHILITLLFSLVVFTTYAIDYKPLLVEGRVWVLTDDYVNSYNNRVDTLMMTVEKDTIVNDIECKKIKTRFMKPELNTLNNTYNIYAIEDLENKSVHYFTDFFKTPKLFISFDEETIVSSTDIIVDSISVKGKNYRRLRNSDKREDSYTSFYAVEEIGKINSMYDYSTGLPPEIMPTGTYPIRHLRKVYENGSLIFEDTDFFAPAIAGVKNVDLIEDDIIKTEYYTTSGYKTDRNNLISGVAIKIDTYSNGKIKVTKVIVR